MGYSEFPETLPYGTHAWKVFKYDLWDAKQNRACKCDPLWTGNDCSLRKCPFGDHPLTVVSYDPETEGTLGTNFMNADTSSSTTASAHALYVGYSPYRQKAERQTLEIDSFHRPNSGTFSLTFTDEYGDEWTTRPIPLVVRLSQTLATDYNAGHATGKYYLDFGNDPGIHKSEISLGDIIRIGNSYRLVTKLEYRRDDNSPSVLDTSKQYYQKIYFASPLAAGSGKARSQQSATTYRKAGTPVYRVTVAKEIREALKALPNDRITDVTVEAITRGGHVLEGTFASSGTGDVNLTWTHSATTLKRDLLSGDIIRFDDEYRVIQSSKDPAYKLDSPYASAIAANSKGYKQNGMKYDITFEQGCRTHEDCRYNGVDENDSDGPAQKVLYEGGDNNAAYCHNGGTCMCTDGFYGPGCTATGRGHHANAKVTASHSAFVLASAGVARINPMTVVLSDPVADNDETSGNDIIEGDHIRIENQVRTVVKVDSAVYVDKPFEEVATSDHTTIFPQYTPVEVIHDMGGVRSSCTVTDLRQLTSTRQVCYYAPGTTRDVRACGHYYANQASTGNADQVMREINSATAGDITTVTINVADSQNLAHTAGQNTYTNTPTLTGVEVGMGVTFKLTDASATTFVNGGTVTEVTTTNSFKTSLVGGAAVATDKWAATQCAGTACQLIFTKESNKDGTMDEREIEIGDRIRVLTALGSWETRTVDSVTYSSSYQVSGFVVSEPYEDGSVSMTQSVTASVNAAGVLSGAHAGTKCKVGDFCRLSGAAGYSYGVHKVLTTTTFDSAYGLPAERASEAITFTRAHFAYNDGAGTTEAKSCSGRGLCDDSSGECQCFKGYTGVDCGIQNALAV